VSTGTSTVEAHVSLKCDIVLVGTVTKRQDVSIKVLKIMNKIIQQIKQAQVTFHSALEAGSAQYCKRVLCCESVGWVSARRWEMECYSTQTKVDGAKQSVPRTMMNRHQADSSSLATAVP